MLASRNAGKLRELRALFGTRGVDVIDLVDAGVAEDAAAEEAIEAYPTFEENALAKAHFFAARLPGRVVVADDSGLVVEALGGEPGVRSKRWSGRADLSGAALDAENNELLLARLAGRPDRAARFVCAAAWTNGHVEIVARGEVPGRIAWSPSGTHGFGYDPYFVVAGLGRTLADATIAEKEGISHRGRAFTHLLELVESRAAAALS
ncbi:MAG: non-canonical purine NTP pyrophosphatase [bacterium]